MEQALGISFTIVNFIIALSVVVFVHELGHFLVARWNKVRCDSFSIGFGPELIGYTDRHGTRWKFSLIPLGGYVKMFGEADIANPGSKEGGENNEDDEAEVEREMTPKEKAISFKYKTIGQRSAIVFAGPAVNFLFAIVVFFVMFMSVGRPVTEPIIGKVVEDSAAAEAGLTAGDRIIAIDGNAVDRFEDLQRIVPLGNGAPMRLTIQRHESVLDIIAVPRVVDETDAFGNPQKRALLGVSSSGETRMMVRHTPISALGLAISQTYFVVEGTFVAVGQIISGDRGTEDLGGPIRIAKFSGQAAKSGFANFVVFMAILSINLGIINLFPVPLLDGGHLLFYAIEALRGRPLSDQAQEWGLRFGLVLVLSLMVFVTWNDILQL
ncbi:MAG: RIP metalloprotease RseP [Rhodospirillaceae bacterium]|nr:RIP metalloprotease RseP [Rhodospirillaceae bacterium]